MADAAVALAILAVLLNLGTFVVLLVLLGGREGRFAKWRDLDAVKGEVRTLAAKMSDLWRYLEVLDDATGGAGHKVLVVGQRMRDDDPPP